MPDWMSARAAFASRSLRPSTETRIEEFIAKAMGMLRDGQDIGC
jgi:hypothetical protein